MTRPPLISTDMRISLLASSLPATFGDFYRLLLPVGALRVLVDLRERGLGEVGPVGVAGRRLRDHVELLGDVGRALEVLLDHDPDSGVVRPDQRVDLVQLPALVPLAQRRTVVEHGLEALLLAVAAKDPAAEARAQEPRRDLLVRLLRDPVAPHEDAVLEHRGTG